MFNLKIKPIFWHSVLALLSLMLSLHTVFVDCKAHGGGKGKKPGGPATTPTGEQTKLKEHKFGVFISQHPGTVFLCIVVVQLLCGILFSYYFKYQYIHHKSRELKKVHID